MNDKPSNMINCRFEKKVLLQSFNFQELEFLVKSHPALFCEIHHGRFINNIYFDYPNLEQYYDNVAGISERRKIRIRWYGDMVGHNERPILEFKEKYGFYVKKQGYPLEDFIIDRQVSAGKLADIFRGSNLPGEILGTCLGMVPLFFNRYFRKYYISSCKRFRLTLDTNLEFFEFGNIGHNFSKKFSDLDTIILELKYDQESIEEEETITSWFPFRITKHSKYVQGLESIFSW